MTRQFCHLQPLGAQHGPIGSLPTSIHTLPVSTPLLADAWHQALLTHRHSGGGSHRPPGSSQLPIYCGQRPSAAAHCEVISSLLASQVEAGYMIGPLPTNVRSNFATSHMVVIPKSTTAKFRVIADLSAPAHNSINDNIHRDLIHVVYSSINVAALLMYHLGKHSLMAKIDIQDGYRLIPSPPHGSQFPRCDVARWGIRGLSAPVWLCFCPCCVQHLC